MSTMVERVARAIDEADVGYSINLTRLVDGVSTYTLRYHGVSDLLEFGSYDEASEHVRATRDERRARAAIEAMMEPTEAMLRCADEVVLTDEEIHRGPFEMSKAEWQAMIQAALKEQA
ncbi:hypothetical protein [Sinorhizobium meliloti]|uniref:hypothetical protein n=1 Tax=Rhizobium meliloti TaxID=382 RepID=UPI001297F7DF|nr:hypothetical protein [Sinorhizobium meliloti]MQX90295.1 hypothetical protein [Sinorhizobium meliloti]